VCDADGRWRCWIIYKQEGESFAGLLVGERGVLTSNDRLDKSKVSLGGVYPSMGFALTRDETYSDRFSRSDWEGGGVDEG